MQIQTSTENKQRLITFSPYLYQIGKAKAKRLGLNFTEYMRFLLVDDIKKSMEKGETIYLIDEETEKKIGESLAEINKGEYTTLETDEQIKRHFTSVVNHNV